MIVVDTNVLAALILPTGKLVLHLPADAEAGSHVFRCNTHMDIFNRADKSIKKHGVFNRARSHAIPRAGLLQEIGRHAHILDAYNQAHVCLSEQDVSGGYFKCTHG